MGEIVVVKPGLLKPRQRRALEASGALVIESDDPNAVRKVRFDESIIQADEMTLAVIEAVVAAPNVSASVAVLASIGEVLSRRLGGSHENVGNVYRGPTVCANCDGVGVVRNEAGGIAGFCHVCDRGLELRENDKRGRRP